MDSKQEKEIKETKKRFSSALILFPIMAIVTIFANDYITDIMLAILSAVCLYEYNNSFKNSKKANPSKWLGYVISILLAFRTLASNFLGAEFVKNIWISLVPISIFMLVLEIIFTDGKKNISDLAISLLGILYIPFNIFFLSSLRAEKNGTQEFINKSLFNKQYGFLNMQGRFLIWYIFICAWGSDIFAYLIGHKFGKHKFTKISPNKSIEGCIAGILGALILGILYTVFLNNVIHFNISYCIIIPKIILLTLIGQIGDLAASSIKRYCGIKDFSDLIPGHGGLLDRIDSVIFMLPFAFLLLF